MEWPIILALVLVIPLILFPATFVWYLNIGGISAAIRERRAARERGKTRATVSIGRWIGSKLIVIGRPMRIAVPIVLSIAIYGLLIWFFLGSFGWVVALAFGLGLPFILIPVAFVWYLNVSGLYQVMRATRQRQRRRAEALREAEGLVPAKVVAAEEQLAEAAGIRRTA